MTGSRSVAVLAGVHTDAYRQSSLSAALRNTMSGNGVVWIHRFPNASALRTPVHLAAGWGAAQRSLPTGGIAYGMPRNARTPAILPVVPSSTPVAIRTWSGACTGVMARATREQQSAAPLRSARRIAIDPPP